MSDAVSRTPYEAPGMGTGRVVTAIVVLFSLVVIAMVAVAGLLKVSMGGVSDPPVSIPIFPAPRLEIDPQADLTAVRRRDHDRLHDSAAIPIDQAMNAIAQRGANAYDPLAYPECQRESPQ